MLRGEGRAVSVFERKLLLVIVVRGKLGMLGVVDWLVRRDSGCLCLCCLVSSVSSHAWLMTVAVSGEDVDPKGIHGRNTKCRDGNIQMVGTEGIVGTFKQDSYSTTVVYYFRTEVGSQTGTEVRTVSWVL